MIPRHPDMPKLVLAVDDEPDILEILDLWLKDFKFRVMTAESGKQALEYFEEFGPDLIILDIMMPGMDGLDVLATIKANPKNRNLPVIMLTAKGDTKSIFEAQRLGVTEFLMKPFEAAELMRVVEKALNY